MGRRLFLPALVLAALAGPAPAGAASLDVAPCHASRATVEIRATGLGANVAVTVRLDGTAVGTATTDAVGSFSASWRAPRVTEEEGRRAFTLDVVDAANAVRAATTLRVSSFTASFAPDSGDPGTWRARFSAHGFRLFGGGDTVYLHYVRPDGRLERTVRIGRAHGPCGTIERTRPRRLFPFAAGPGTWTLQFDTRRRYQRSRRPFVSRRIRIVRVG